MMAKNKRYIEILKWIWLVDCFSALVISVACWLPSMVDQDMAFEMVLVKLIQEEGHFEFQISCIEHKGLRYVLFITFFANKLLRFATLFLFFEKFQDDTRYHFHVHMCTHDLDVDC